MTSCFFLWRVMIRRACVCVCVLDVGYMPAARRRPYVSARCAAHSDHIHGRCLSLAGVDEFTTVRM